MDLDRYFDGKSHKIDCAKDFQLDGSRVRDRLRKRARELGAHIFVHPRKTPRGYDWGHLTVQAAKMPA